MCAKKRVLRVFQTILLTGILLLNIQGSEAEEAGGAERFVYQRSDRDPFWPLVTEDGKLVQGFDVFTLESIYLEGIVWDRGGDSVVMINGMVLRKGDRIGGFEILKIENNRVTLRAGSERRYLNLEEK